MYKFAAWIRINQTQTINTFIWANNHLEVRQIAEAQYGSGSLLHSSQLDE